MVKKIMVVGAGLMGSGISQTLATHGYHVTMVDIKKEYLKRSLENIECSLKRLIEKRKVSKEHADKTLSLIEISSDYIKNADIVIEAVNENINIKKELFKKLDEICDKKTILASNTSTLSITALGASTNRPDKVIGMHFFIPATVMKLVEITPGLKTSEETVKTINELSKSLKKIAVFAKDTPGFIVNRLFVPMWNEAMFLVMEGLNPKEVDNAMKHGTNIPMGPLELADFAGLDTVLSVMNALYDGFHDSKFRPCPLLIKMVEAGNLGVKTKEGFYKYKGEKNEKF